MNRLISGMNYWIPNDVKEFSFSILKAVTAGIVATQMTRVVTSEAKVCLVVGSGTAFGCGISSFYRMAKKEVLAMNFSQNQAAILTSLIVSLPTVTMLGLFAKSENLKGVELTILKTTAIGIPLVMGIGRVVYDRLQRCSVRLNRELFEE